MIQHDLASEDGTIVINMNTGIADANGAIWYVTDLAGWETPEVRQKTLDRVGDHGVVVAESFFAKRALVLTGFCKVPSDTAYWASWNKLGSIVSKDLVGNTHYSQLTVHEVPTPRYAMVKLEGRAKQKISVGEFEFALPFLAPDPRKYLVGAGAPGSVGNPGVF